MNTEKGKMTKNETNEIQKTQVFKGRAKEAVRSSEKEWPERDK